MTTTGLSRSLRRLGIAAVVASFIGIWGYVLFLSATEGRPTPRDRLDDRAYTERLELACLPYAERVDALPSARSMTSPVERARLLDEATDLLEAMVADLHAVAVTEDEDEAAATRLWLADWEQYLRDRRAYADRFRAGEDEPFRVTDRGGFQIDVLVDEFAKVNFMESCMTPDDA